MQHKSVFLELTDNCNLSCEYCNKHYGFEYIDLALFENVVRQVAVNKKILVRMLCLWWWEPFLHPKIWDIFQILKTFFQNYVGSFDIIINTNWLLLRKNRDLLDSLVEELANINFIVYVSLDGIWKEGNINRAITNKQYYWIVDSVKYLKNKKLENLTVKVSSVLSFKNSPLSQLRSFVSYFDSLGVDINFCFQEFVSWKEKKIKKDELKLLLKKYIFLKKKKIDVYLESKNEFNDNYRINVKGVVNKHIDGSFDWSDKFIISKEWDIKNIENETSIDITNDEIWWIMYAKKDYIKLISIIYNSTYKDTG